MKPIGKHTYLEGSYDGVVSGAIKLDRGSLLLDSPMCFSDQSSWRQKVSQFGDGDNWFFLMLDPHIDRTLGLDKVSTATRPSTWL